MIELVRAAEIGGHRDAWGPGAADNISGTISVLEAAHAIADQVKAGKRPKRTIIFATWDAEDWGLLGSTEFVEEDSLRLSKSAVAYLNQDMVGRGMASDITGGGPDYIHALMLAERLAGQLGASRKDGDRFQCCDVSSHGEADETWEGLDAKGARIEVRCWKHLHLRTARWVEVSLIQIIRHGASGKARDPKISWFVWKGQPSAPLAEISPTYRLRYSHEHGYRFDKQELLWDEPRLSTPQRTERWTHIVACAHNLLVLARPLVEEEQLGGLFGRQGNVNTASSAPSRKLTTCAPPGRPAGRGCSHPFAPAGRHGGAARCGRGPHTARRGGPGRSRARSWDDRPLRSS